MFLLLLCPAEGLVLRVCVCQQSGYLYIIPIIMTALAFLFCLCGCSYNVYYVNIAWGCFFLAQGLPVVVVGGSPFFCSVCRGSSLQPQCSFSGMRIAMCCKSVAAKNVTEKNNRRAGSGSSKKDPKATVFPVAGDFLLMGKRVDFIYSSSFILYPIFFLGGLGGLSKCFNAV